MLIGGVAAMTATYFVTQVTPQAAVATANKAPKQFGMPEYAFALNYGYHLDAGKFAELLKLPLYRAAWWLSTYAMTC